MKPSRDLLLARFSARCVERAESDVRDRADVSPDDVQGLHDLRIAYKQVRYAIDVFEEVLPDGSKARAKEAASYQKRLGEIHDVDMARVTVARARALTPALRAKVDRALVKAREDQVGKFLLLCITSPVRPPSPA